MKVEKFKRASSRVLVIKHGALGDMVQGLDAFASLRGCLPSSHIALLTSPPFAGFASCMPWFDEIIVDPRAHALNLLQLLRIRGILRHQWDVVLDLQCSRRTARYLSLSDRNTTRWFGTAPGASDPYPDFTGVNNADRMKIAVGMVCDQADGKSVRVADLGWLKDAATDIDVPDKAFVMVPGCSPAKPSKRWSPARFAMLAGLAASAGYRPVIVGTAADRAAGDAVLKDAPDCVDLVGRTSLPQLARLFANAAMVVGNDTGPVFLAAKAGVPTLMVMGPDTDPESSAPQGPRVGWLKGASIDDVCPEDVMKHLMSL